MPIVSDSSSPTSSYSFLKQQRVLTTSLDYVDLATLEGARYDVYFDEELSSEETKYIIYQFPPASSNLIGGLSHRIFKAMDGDASLEILWETEGYQLLDPLDVFNTNQNSPNVAQTEVHTLSGVPTSEGVLREPDFVIGEGRGNNSNGSISPAQGIRLYSPDSFFVAKVTNLHTQANRIHLAYSLLEIPKESFNI